MDSFNNNNNNFSFCENGLIFLEITLILRTCGDYRCKIFYMPKVLPVTQPTVSTDKFMFTSLNISHKPCVSRTTEMAKCFSFYTIRCKIANRWHPNFISNTDITHGISYINILAKISERTECVSVLTHARGRHEHSRHNNLCNSFHGGSLWLADTFTVLREHWNPMHQLPETMPTSSHG